MTGSVVRYLSATKPHMQGNGKYAVMTDEYESVNVKGMYFAGQLAHGKDFRSTVCTTVC